MARLTDGEGGLGCCTAQRGRSGREGSRGVDSYAAGSSCRQGRRRGREALLVWCNNMDRSRSHIRGLHIRLVIMTRTVHLSGKLLYSLDRSRPRHGGESHSQVA